MVDGALACFWYLIEFGLKDKKGHVPEVLLCQKYYYARSTTMTEILLISLYHFRLIILSWGLERSFGDKLAITLSRNFVSVCNFMTVNDFYIRYGTLPHTFSHFCHTLGKLHTLWEV
jgi:hypothetical protein